MTDSTPQSPSPQSSSPQSPAEIPIRDESIRLGQLLKLSGLAENGAIAREVIDSGAVQVNGEVETRRGRQVLRGDRVSINGEEFGLPPEDITPVAEQA